MKKREKNTDVSVVIPVYNEKENTSLLYRDLKTVLNGLKCRYEILFVDDGSTDGTREVLRDLSKKDSAVRTVFFRGNFGQSSAMAAGFQISRGEIVISMDGDLQNDPKEIPRLIEKLNEGYDVVSGWRKQRKDKFLSRRLPSWIANRLICSVTDVNLHDTGCSLKAYRKEVIKKIRLYGELHRFIPALAKVEGARISETAVNHLPRRFGKSKYNLTRTFRVLMDLGSLNLFLKYLRNPLRFFGMIGAWFFGSGIVLTAWVVYQIGTNSVPFYDLNVLVTLVFLLWAMGFQSLFLGLVAILIVRTGSRKGYTLSPFLIQWGHHGK
jgi:glycosyltransferase involved in cell wall biosynthesis